MRIIDQELTILEAAMKTLEPFNVEMSTERHISLSKFSPCVSSMPSQCRPNTTWKTTKHAVEREIKNIQEKTHLRFATLLDPGFKRNGLCNDTVSDLAMEELRAVAEYIKML